MMRQSKKLLLIGTAAIAVLIAVAVIALAADNKQQPAAAANGHSPAAAKLPQKTVYLVIKDGRIANGPSDVTVYAGQPIKMTVHGEGYGEGDNLYIQGQSSIFFELDELDTPTTAYFSIPQSGAYAMTVNTTGQHIGDIIVK